MALSARTLYASDDATLARVACDGIDPARPQLEPTRRDSIVIVLRGAFELRDAKGRVVLDPSLAFTFQADSEYVVRHPCGGGDLCLSLSGPAATRLAQTSPRLKPIEANDWARVLALAGAINSPEDAAALEEALYEALAPESEAPPKTARGRELAEEVGHVLRRHPGARLSLSELGRAVGYSEFHLCRVFRRATGTTIQAFHLELRLRHALALTLDTKRALADIALETGFSGQAHLTNRFRDRFGVTPGRARAGASLRAGV